MDIIATLTSEFDLKPWQVENTVNLIDEGNTIPFIARYRKEAHGSLDDQVLRELNDRLTYLRNLDKRREEILNSIEEQGKLTDELKAKIDAATVLAELEDLYRPYKQKRRTRAMMAKEKGLEPLAMYLWERKIEEATLEEAAAPYVDAEKGVETVEDALQGASDIIAELISDDADVRKALKEAFTESGIISSKAAKEEDSVYAQYYEFESLRGPREGRRASHHRPHDDPLGPKDQEKEPGRQQKEKGRRRSTRACRRSVSL